MKKQLLVLLNHKDLKKYGILPTIEEKENYIEKICKYAVLIPFYKEGIIKAFIAFYANDVEKKTAFLSMICVDEELSGSGIGKGLLLLSIQYLKKANFIKYSLEVNKNNIIAYNLYTNCGFVT